MNHASPSGGSKLPRLLLAACGLLVSLLAIELLLRPATFPGKAEVGTTRTKRAKIYGWALEPGKQIDFPDPDTGRSFSFRVNAHGWKDLERSIAKPTGTVRILVLGDSYTFGYVPLEELYTRRLEAMLRQRGSTNVEVLSMGVGGWGTDQQLEALKREGMAFSPDIVICQFCANDLHNNLEPLVPGWRATPFDTIHTRKTFCYVLESGQLRKVAVKVQPKPAGRRIKDALLCSAVIHRLNQARLGLRGGVGSEAIHQQDTNETRRSHHLDPTRPGFLYGPDDGSRQRHEKWALLRALYAAMQGTCRAGGATFAVFSEAGDLGRRDYFLQKGLIRQDGEFFYIPWQGRRYPFDIRQPLHDLEALCAGLEIPVIPPRSGYQRFQNDPHTNAEGNLAMAQDLADFLLSHPDFSSLLKPRHAEPATPTR